MPPRSQSATPGSRTGSQTSSDHPPRDGHKQRSSGSNRAKTCRPKPGYTSHGFDKVPSSGGFRISSTPPQHIKLDRKINAAHNNSAKTTPKEGTSGNGGGSGGRGSGGYGNKHGGSGIGSGLSGNGKEGCGNRLCSGGSGCGSGGNGSGSDGSKSSARGLTGRGSGSRSENGMRSSAKQVFTVPAQLTMKPRKPSLATNPDIFKRFGPSSEMAESTVLCLPDPYAELTKQANEEIKLRDQADPTTKAKLEPNPPAAGSAMKAGVSTPAPRASSFLMSQTHSAGAIVNGTARGSAVSSETSTNGKSSRGGGGLTGGSASGQRGGLSRRPSSCSGDGRSSKSDLADDGGRASTGGHRGGHRGKRVVSSCSDKSSKVDKLHDASQREQEEDDDEEDETGMPQAVRLPESTTDEVETYQDIVKRLHGAQMETIAKNVKPKHLLRYLAEDGYFRYDYSDHTRTSSDNHNLKYGMKRGVERLYLWLAMYSPPEENTQT